MPNCTARFSMSHTASDTSFVCDFKDCICDDGVTCTCYSLAIGRRQESFVKGWLWMKTRALRRSVVVAVAMLVTTIYSIAQPVHAAPGYSPSSRTLTAQVGSAIRNSVTGQVINLPVYETQEYVMVSDSPYLKQTVTVGVPKQIFYGASQQTAVTPDSVTSNYDCDSSIAWCVTLTMYYYRWTDGPSTCIQVQSPGYNSKWTNKDRTVLLSNTSMNLGIASGSKLQWRILPSR